MKSSFPDILLALSSKTLVGNKRPEDEYKVEKTEFSFQIENEGNKKYVRWTHDCNKCVFLHKSSYLRTASSSSCGLFVAPITSTLSSPADCTYKPKQFFPVLLEKVVTK